MNKKKILKLFAMTLTTAATLQTVEGEEKITKESVLEQAQADAINDKVEIGTTIYEREVKPITKKHTKDAKSIKLRDIVTVSGKGVASSYGTGVKTRKYKEEKMAVVGVKEDRKYPYALARINEDGSLDNVVGWFKRENIKAKIKITKTTELAPITKEIVDIKDVAVETGKEYDEETGEYVSKIGIPIISGYEWLNNEFAIKVAYTFQEPEEYDSCKTENITDEIEAHIYKIKDKEIIYYCNRLDGSYWYFTTERNKIDEDKKTLQKRYGIKND